MSKRWLSLAGSLPSSTCSLLWWNACSPIYNECWLRMNSAINWLTPTRIPCSHFCKFSVDLDYMWSTLAIGLFRWLPQLICCLQGFLSGNGTMLRVNLAKTSSTYLLIFYIWSTTAIGIFKWDPQLICSIQGWQKPRQHNCDIPYMIHICNWSFQMGSTTFLLSSRVLSGNGTMLRLNFAKTWSTYLWYFIYDPHLSYQMGSTT